MNLTVTFNQPASQPLKPAGRSCQLSTYTRPEKSTTQGRWGLGGAIGRQFLLQQIDSSGLQRERAGGSRVCLCVCLWRGMVVGVAMGGVDVGVSESLTRRVEVGGGQGVMVSIGELYRRRGTENLWGESESQWLIGRDSVRVIKS